MKIYFILISLFIYSSPLYSAFDYPASSAQSAASCNSYIASTYALNGLLLNPALAANNQAFYAALNYYQLFDMKELRYANGILAFPWRRISWGISMESFGNSIYQETSLSFSAARLFYNQTVAIGIALKVYYLSVKNYRQQQCCGINLGIRYKLLTNLHLAGTIENMNSPQLNGYSEELPERFQVGAQYSPLPSLTLHLAIRKDHWFAPEVLIGARYQFSKFLNLYSGYDPARALPSVGIALKASHIQIDYAVQHHFELGITHFTGISFSGS